MRTGRWCVCGCIALGLSSGVFAAPNSQEGATQEIKVNYGDLDLNKAAGAATLYDRIEAAARKVCSPASSGDYLRNKSTYRSCYRQAVDNAVADVNRPAVLALHRQGPPRG